MHKADNNSSRTPEDYLSSDMSKKRQEHWAKVWIAQDKKMAEYEKTKQRQLQYESDKKKGLVI